MSKRSSQASRSPQKRSRLTSEQQPRIDHFFASAANNPPKTPEKLVISPQRPEPGLRPSVPVEVIDVDSLDAGPSHDGRLEQIDTANGRLPQARVLLNHANDTKPPSFASLLPDPLYYDVKSQSWSYPSTPYSFLSHTFSTLAETRSRIAIINCLTNTLRTIMALDPSSLLPSLYLLSNSLGPPYMAVELGVGPALLSQSIQAVSGLSSSAIKRLYNSLGDAGDVAFASKSNLRTLVPHPPLLIKPLYQSLLSIAQLRGPGTTKRRQNIIEKLLVSATGEEVRFLVRTLAQNLRVGAVRISILVALARAAVLTPTLGRSLPSASPPPSQPLSPLSSAQSTELYPSESRADLLARFVRAESLVKRVYVRHPNFDHLVAALLEVGFDGLEEKMALDVGIPLLPTLGTPTRSLEQVYNLLGDRHFTAEYKYDGQRAQIHGLRRTDGTVLTKIFSRHLEDMTSKFPDVVALVAYLFESSPPLASFILDSEIVATDPETDRLKSFQELSNRARKNVKLEAVSVTVTVFVFDVMYYNNESFLQHSFRERSDLLRSTFPPTTPQQELVARLRHVESCGSEQGKEAVLEFWERAVGSSCEGLMIKLLDHERDIVEVVKKKDKSRRKAFPATYEPDKRTAAWLKLKKDYVDGIGDSLDLVPIGAWHGNGRKVEWWSPILLGLWDPDLGRFVAVCKCMSGYTDAFYRALNERYKLDQTSMTCSSKPLWECDVGDYRPDVFFRPQEVWEIRGADITLSPVSVAAKNLTESGRGLSLRFPRFIRVREDKVVHQASSASFLAALWSKQQKRGSTIVGNDDGELMDVSVNSSAASSESESDRE